MKRIIFLSILLLMPITAWAETLDGKALYSSDCIACHAADGSGNTQLGRQIRPYPAKDLRPKILSREEIRQAITEGRQKTGMHAHGNGLDLAAVDRLIDYILSFSYQAKPDRGGQLFKQQCSRCHGADAQGIRAGKAPGLIMSELSDIGMARVIRFGHKGTIMGEFKHDLGNDEVEDILAWLRLQRYGLPPE